ncbi:MAG: translation initiation factor IF-5A [archaeon]
MDIKQSHAGGLKPGRYVVFDDLACVVKSVQTSRTGKHGHAKCRIEAVSIKDGRKIIKIIPAHDNVDTPIIEKKTAQVLSVKSKTANVMDMESFETFDVVVPQNLEDQVKEGSQIVYWIVLGDKIVQQVK